MNKIKFTILFFTLLNYSFVFNQMQTKGYFGLNQIFHPTKDFTESNLDLGMSFQFDKFSISPFILYQFGGNYKINNYKPYTLNYNLIGAGLGVKMRGTDKKYVPEVKLFFSKEFFPSYGGFSKTLNDKLSLFTSQTSSDEKIIILENSYENLLAYQHYLFYYYGTNINASINIAHHFKIFNGFYLNISIGYSYREIKYKYFNKTLNYYDLSYFSDNRYFYKGVHLLDLGIGLSYTFGRNHQVEKAKKQNEINTSTLNKGMYFIQLEKQSFTVKFTK